MLSGVLRKLAGIMGLMFPTKGKEKLGKTGMKYTEMVSDSVLVRFKEEAEKEFEERMRIGWIKGINSDIGEYIEKLYEYENEKLSKNSFVAELIKQKINDFISFKKSIDKDM